MVRLVALLLAISLIFAACEEPLKIYVEGDNPPTFTFSGSGTLNFLVVTEPVDSPNSLTPWKTLWKLVPRAKIHAWYLPKIVYGIVPDGFVQELPQEGPPPPLKEGKIYGIGGPTTGAEGGSIWFTIKDGKAIRVPKTNGELDR